MYELVIAFALIINGVDTGDGEPIAIQRFATMDACQAVVESVHLETRTGSWAPVKASCRYREPADIRTEARELLREYITTKRARRTR